MGWLRFKYINKFARCWNSYRCCSDFDLSIISGTPRILSYGLINLELLIDKPESATARIFMEFYRFDNLYDPGYNIGFKVLIKSAGFPFIMLSSYL